MLLLKEHLLVSEHRQATSRYYRAGRPPSMRKTGPLNLFGYVKYRHLKTFKVSSFKLKRIRGCKHLKTERLKMVKNPPTVPERFVARNYCDRMYHLLQKLEGFCGQQT